MSVEFGGVQWTSVEFGGGRWRLVDVGGCWWMSVECRWSVSGELVELVGGVSVECWWKSVEVGY